MSDIMTLEQALVRLAEFKTTKSLAQFLKREGIKYTAKRGPRAYHCPLALWLKKVLGESPESFDVTVTAYNVWHGSGKRATPTVCVQFITEFDSNDKKFKFLRH